MTEPSRRPTGTIVVSGTGRVAVEPDVAELRLGVVDLAPDRRPRRARRAAEAMAAILAAVTGAGVDRRDVRTTTLSVQPRYDYRDGKPPSADRLRPRQRRDGHRPRPGRARRRDRRRADGRAPRASTA